MACPRATDVYFGQRPVANPGKVKRIRRSSTVTVVALRLPRQPLRRCSRRPRCLDDEIAGIVDRLEQRYPVEVVSGFDLEERVRGVYRQFGTAHLRTYVAIFVERLVRRSIDERSGSHQTQSRWRHGFRTLWRDAAVTLQQTLPLA
jgi:hypothetical protein